MWERKREIQSQLSPKIVDRLFEWYLVDEKMMEKKRKEERGEESWGRFSFGSCVQIPAFISVPSVPMFLFSLTTSSSSFRSPFLFPPVLQDSDVTSEGKKEKSFKILFSQKLFFYPKQTIHLFCPLSSPFALLFFSLSYLLHFLPFC